MSQNNEILFSGTGPSQVKTPEFQKRKGPPTWFSIMEQAFFQVTSTDEGKKLYGDPNKGATIEQAWRTVGLLSAWSPVCLVASDKPPVSTSEIKEVIKMNSKELVNTLSKLLLLGKEVSSPTFYYDGQTGHCVTLFKFDTSTSRFTYLDPWPGTSLLSKEYNAAGVDAVNVEKNLWSITSEELERVIMAAFVFQADWASYNGQKNYLTYAEFQNTDFYKFFHTHETGRDVQEIEGFLHDNTQVTIVRLEPGAFQPEIRLEITLDEQTRLRQGVLAIKRSWLIGKPFGINPYALDILKSFIATITPQTERPIMDQLITKLYNLRNPNYVKQVISDKKDQPLLTFLGDPQSAELIRELFIVNMQNLIFNNEAWLETRINLFFA